LVNLTWLANHRAGGDLVARYRPRPLFALLQGLELNEGALELLTLLWPAADSDFTKRGMG
jgi:hypothetical protein